jgi:hypothetical protein
VAPQASIRGEESKIVNEAANNVREKRKKEGCRCVGGPVMLIQLV